MLMKIFFKKILKVVVKTKCTVYNNYESDFKA